MPFLFRAAKLPVRAVTTFDESCAPATILKPIGQDTRRRRGPPRLSPLSDTESERTGRANVSTGRSSSQPLERQGDERDHGQDQDQAQPVRRFFHAGVVMRFRIDVNSLDGKMSYERNTPDDALHVAEGGKQSLGVTITDTEDGKTYSPDEFRKRFGH
jgi:hypothetical protein